MQVPIRKPGKYTHAKTDPHLTPGKFDALKKQLDLLLRIDRPPAIREVKRLAEMGDFSENAAYQIAKGRLRWINERILTIEDRVKKAVIIKPNSNDSRVQLGSQVTVSIGGQGKIYTILGSTETDPGQGVISHNSPLGKALMGKRAGDIFSVLLGGKEVKIEILKAT